MNHDIDTPETTSEAIEGERAITQPVENGHEPESSTEHAEPLAGNTEVHAEEVKLVPVGEAIRYRKRAQAAEKRVEELHGQLTVVEAHLHETKRQIDDAQRYQEVHHALLDAGAMDVETARLVVENVLDEGTDEEGERGIEEVVRIVRERKPFLFRTEVSAPSRGAVMGGHLRPPQTNRATPLHHAASEARHSGRRQDLMRYMRLRRTEH